MFMLTAVEAYIGKLVAEKTDKIVADYHKPITPELVSRAASRAEKRVTNMFLPQTADRSQRRQLNDRVRLNDIVLRSLGGHGSEIEYQTIWADTKDPRLLKLQELIRDILPQTLRFSQQPGISIHG